MGDCSLTLRLAPDQAALAALPERLDQFAEAADLPPAALQRLALVCDELAANIVHHGARSSPPASFLAIRIDRHAERLELLVEDDGRPFDPLSLPAPDVDAPLEERQVGGLGLHLVRTMAQEIRYERTDRLNRLRLVMAV